MFAAALTLALPLLAAAAPIAQRASGARGTYYDTSVSNLFHLSRSPHAKSDLEERKKEKEPQSNTLPLSLYDVLLF